MWWYWYDDHMMIFPHEGWSTLKNKITPRKLTWQWNIPILCRKYIFKWSIFDCYVSLFWGVPCQAALVAAVAWSRQLDGYGNTWGFSRCQRHSLRQSASIFVFSCTFHVKAAILWWYWFVYILLLSMLRIFFSQNLDLKSSFDQLGWWMWQSDWRLWRWALLEIEAVNGGAPCRKKEKPRNQDWLKTTNLYIHYTLW